MSPARRAAVIRVADAITEGAAVDWQQERIARPELAATLDCLQLVEEISRGYRSIGEASPARPPIRRRPTRPPSPPETPSGQEPALFTWGSLCALELIGEGAFGEVYRAHDPSLERDVALKLLRRTAAPDASVERFLLEARRLARVRHPNVLVVHGAERHAGRPGMWTDLIRGQTLEQLLARQGPFGAREAGLLAIEVCGALAAVHAAGLVHRDVKTANVMREVGGRIVLMDFGAVGELTASGSVRVEDGAIGTPLTLAPELLRGEPASPASDIYALGVFVYRLLTAAYPVEAQNLEELQDKHRRGDRLALRDRRPDLPSRFVQAVETALEPDAGSRHHGPGAMERSLAESLNLATAPASTKTRRGRDDRGKGPVAAAPAPAGLVPHNLPEAVTGFLGREAEVAACLRLLRESRWLTLVGPSGCGKTRLALRLAEASLEAFPDGVWFVDLEGMADPDAAPRALSSVLGIGRARVDAVVERLRDACALVVLDHAEDHAAATTTLCNRLLAECAKLRLVVTSREAVGGALEQTHEVPPPVRMRLEQVLRPAHDDAVRTEVGASLVPPGARIPFVGRQQQLGVLVDALERARLRSGSAIVISGEAGVGKSRLMAEFRARAEAGGLLCLGGRCAFRGGRNFEPFVEALEEFGRRFGSGRAEPPLDALGSRSGTLFSTLNALLDPHNRSAPEPMSREQVWVLLDALLKSISKYETLVLLLDDLHWADEGTLSLLTHVTRNLGGSRLLIVGSYRSEEIGTTGRQEHSLEDVLQLLSPMARFVRLSLPPLELPDTQSLVERMLDDTVRSGEWAPVIHDHAQGNPFFTIEIVRDLASRDEPAAAHGRHPVRDLALPQTVTDVLMRRLARLSADERDVLDLAAVEGESFHTDTVVAGTGVARMVLLKRLRALDQIHHLVVSTDEGHRFSHGLVREVLLQAMPPELRREYHGMVADHLMHIHRDRPDYAGRIGEQLFEARRFGEAVPFLLGAAREARRLFLNERALVFLEHALEAQGHSPGPSARRGEVLRTQSEVLLLLGRPHAARQAAEAAMDEEGGEGDDSATAAGLESLGDAALAEGDLVAAERFLTGARQHYAKGSDLRPVARCDQKLGATATRRGDFEQALQRLSAALECSKDAGDQREVARVRLDMGDVLYKRGDFAGSLATFEAAVADVRRFDQRHDLARGLTRLGNALFQSGRPDQALARYEEALALASRLGDVQGMARLEANLGNVHLVRGDPEQALRSYRKALASFEEIGDQTGVGQTLLALGNVCYTRGQFDEAASHYRRSLEPREAMGDRWGLANSLHNLAVVEFHLGRWSSALEHLEAAVSHREELGDRLGHAESALELGAMNAVLGDVEAAQRRFTEADRTSAAMGDARKRARALLSSACLRLWADDADGARELVGSARTLAVEESPIRARQLLLDGLLESSANPDGAENLLREAVDEARRSGSLVEQATAQLALAGHYLTLDRRHEAAIHLETGLSLVDAGRVPLLELHGMRLLSRLEEGREPSLEPPSPAPEARIRELVELLSNGMPRGRSATRDFSAPLFPLP